MEGSLENRERRRYPRVVTNFPLLYQEKDASCLRGGIVVNAGEGGFLIKSTRDTPVGTELNVTVVFSKGFESANFKAVARIVWKGPCWKGDWKGSKYWEGYQYGLEFIQISDEDRCKLNYLLGDRFESEGKTSAEGIYSAGDCAETTHLVTEQKVWIPLGSTANKQGRVVGTNVCGEKATFPGVIKIEKIKVVVHFSDGNLIKGFTLDFSPNKERFHIIPADNPSGGAIEVSTKDLKAVFLVRDFVGDPLYNERKKYVEGEKPSGKKVEVTFSDGEVLVGSTLGYDPKRQGFFIFPADPKSNNIRVYAVCSAVEKARYL